MSDYNQLSENKSDELDLLAMFEIVLLFLRKFGRTILLFSILGLIIGIVIFFISPKQYYSKLVLHSVTLTNQEQIQIIDSWKDLLRKQEYKSLAAIMHTDEGLLKKLTYIKADEIQKLNIQNNPNGFIVEVYVKDTSILDTLQRCIISGLESGDYIRDRLAIKKSNLKDLIEKVQQEIGKLDSVKLNVENIINNKRSNTPPLIIDISGINMQWIALNEKLLAYKEELKFVNAVHVLQNFNKTSKPDKPGLFKTIVLGLFGGIFIGSIIAIIKQLFQKLRTRAVTSIRHN